MNYDEFLESIAEYVRENVGDTEVGIHTITKNNGIELSGLSFRDKRVNASPTIYMEHYYNRYVQGEDIDEIGDSIISVYLKNSLKSDLDIENYTDFSRVSNKLFLKLVNYEKNKSILENTPHEKYMDLVLIPYCCLNDSQIGNGSITVRNDHLKLWNKSAEEVLGIARENTVKNMACDVKPLIDILMTQYDDIKSELPDTCDTPDNQMMVVTNEIKMYGAVFMAFKEKMSQFAKLLGGDYYILPSSIHELILLPQTGAEDFDSINTMIREINATEVAPDEILSDHAYLYSEKDEVLIF